MKSEGVKDSVLAFLKERISHTGEEWRQRNALAIVGPIYRIATYTSFSTGTIEEGEETYQERLRDITYILRLTISLAYC
jgi:hypothetical protein